jgi:hypothetical protein
LGKLLRRVAVVHVTQCDDILAFSGDRIHVRATLAADANAGYIYVLIRRQALRSEDASGRNLEQADG